MIFQYSKKREKSKEHENPSSAEDFRVSPIKEKRVSVFQLSTYSSKSEQWSFAQHPCCAHYRIFAVQKYATVLQKYDTASVPCVEREVLRVEIASVSYHKAHINVALCVLIRNRRRLSYLVITSE